MNERQELQRLTGLSIFTEGDIQRYAALAGVALDGTLPTSKAKSATGDPRFLKRDVVTHLKTCRRMRPVSGLSFR